MSHLIITAVVGLKIWGASTVVEEMKDLELVGAWVESCLPHLPFSVAAGRDLQPGCPVKPISVTGRRASKMTRGNVQRCTSVMGPGGGRGHGCAQLGPVTRDAFQTYSRDAFRQGGF